jgi:hypothetical protein
VGRVRVARGFVRQLVGQLTGADVDAAVLCTSELVTNALVHATGEVGLHLEGWADGTVRLRVCDHSSAPPRAGAPSTVPEASRGLLLVDALTARWGVEPAPGGKAVWCDIPRVA